VHHRRRVPGHWYTTDEQQAVEGLDPGEFREKKVWIKDVDGAVAVTLAVKRAMPNTAARLANTGALSRFKGATMISRCERRSGP
jgi:hypothetical protein